MVVESNQLQSFNEQGLMKFKAHKHERGRCTISTLTKRVCSATQKFIKDCEVKYVRTKAFKLICGIK